MTCRILRSIDRLVCDAVPVITQNIATTRRPFRKSSERPEGSDEEGSELRRRTLAGSEKHSSARIKRGSSSVPSSWAPGLGCGQ